MNTPFNNSPLERYQLELQNEGFSYDPVQEAAVALTDDLYKRLIKADDVYESDTKQKGILARLFKRNEFTDTRTVKGLYLWGGVGRGKTFIVDNFFHCLPFKEKKRIHFHRFMQEVHHELKKLDNVQEPLMYIADKFAQDFRVLCFDEFHVSDITDAMLLGKLLQGLFDRGVCLVATSNDAPDELYKGGLQRARFLPAIDLLKKYTLVSEVDNGIDYRFRVLQQAEIFHSPLDDDANNKLADYFDQLSPDHVVITDNLTIEGRQIKPKKHTDGVVWFDFSELCDGPRGAADYIEIAKEFQTVLISDIPVLGKEQDDQARRFMTMIDEFYDHKVKVIMTAAAPISDLYQGQRLSKSFKRTVSRLQEMCTVEYLQQTHIV